MKTIFKIFSFIALAVSIGLVSCEDEPLQEETQDVPKTGNTFNYDPNSMDWELAKRCALYSALAYQETRIMKKSSNTLPSEAEFNDLLFHYTTNNILYYYSPNGKDKYVKDKKTPVVLHTHLKWEGFRQFQATNHD